MTPTARAHAFVDQVVEKKERYLIGHNFRVAGRTLYCPGLQVGSRRVDEITFSSEALAQEAWVAIGNNLLSDMLEKRAAGCMRWRYNSHTADRDRRRDELMASILRRQEPRRGYPLPVYNEMLRAAGFPEIR